MKAMILAAGYGKRMMPLTENVPKPLLKIGNESLIERNINALLAAGFNDIIINVSYLGSMIKKHVLEIFPNANISFSEEEIPLGTGGGVLNAIGLLGKDPFLLINADIYHQSKTNFCQLFIFTRYLKLQYLYLYGLFLNHSSSFLKELFTSRRS